MDKEKYMVGKISRFAFAISTYLILALLIMITWIALDEPTPATALSINITGQSTTQALGARGASVRWTSSGSPNSWTVVNDATSGAVHIGVMWSVTSPPSSLWTSAASNGTNIFVLTAWPSTGGSQSITSSNANLFWTVQPNSSDLRKFGLSFQTPSAGEQGEHTLIIVLTAAAPVIPCTGYNNVYCWHKSQSAGADCTAVCASYGGVASSPSITQDLGYSVCLALSAADPYGTYSANLNGTCTYGWEGNCLPATIAPFSGNCYYPTTSGALTCNGGWLAYGCGGDPNFYRMCPCAY